MFSERVFKEIKGKFMKNKKADCGSNHHLGPNKYYQMSQFK